jgi:hypothetical protein
LDGPVGDTRVTGVQITGRAGDVVCMHPLLLHCGTMNLRDTPRVLANGMATLSPAAFAFDAAAAAATGTRAGGVGSATDSRVGAGGADGAGGVGGGIIKVGGCPLMASARAAYERSFDSTRSTADHTSTIKALQRPGHP